MDTDKPTNTPEDGFDFGAYAIVDDYEYHFKKMPEATWLIKPVTSGHELQRSRFMMHNRIVEDASGTRYELPPTAVEIRNREVALLSGGTNLKTRAGKPVLREGASVSEVEAVLAKMPPEMVNELWCEVGRLYPKWGPTDPNIWTEETAAES